MHRALVCQLLRGFLRLFCSLDATTLRPNHQSPPRKRALTWQRRKGRGCPFPAAAVQLAQCTGGGYLAVHCQLPLWLSEQARPVQLGVCLCLCQAAGADRGRWVATGKRLAGNMSAGKKGAS